MNRSSGGRGVRSPYLALLPLRFFLGVTFLYAGLDKLLDPTFLQATGRGSIGAQMTAWVDISPIGGLVQTFLPYAVPVGLAIAFAEVCIGIGAVLGLAYRLSAIGGMLLSLLFFLTASWAVRPYYLGNDLPYAVGWATLALAGSGGMLTVDAWLSGRASRARVGGPADGRTRQRRLILRAGVLAFLGLCVAGIATLAQAALGGRSGGGPAASPSPSVGAEGSPSIAPSAVGRSFAVVRTVAIDLANCVPVDVPEPVDRIAVAVSHADCLALTIAVGTARRKAPRTHRRRHGVAPGGLPGSVHERSRDPVEAGGWTLRRVRYGLHPRRLHGRVRSVLGLPRLPLPLSDLRSCAEREGHRRTHLHPLDGISHRGRPGRRNHTAGRGVGQRSCGERRNWSGRRDSNPRHPAWKASAPPTELLPLVALMVDGSTRVSESTACAQAS